VLPTKSLIPIQAEEKLAQAEEKVKIESAARAKAEESLNAKSEEQQRVEAQVKEAIGKTFSSSRKRSCNR